jgi:V/A-type H+-transporting ATPase subunit G/H
MIEEVLVEIREAEEKADAMVKDANAEGKQIVLQAEADADKQKKLTVSGCKDDTKKALQKAEKQAADKRDAILKKGQEQANSLIEDKHAEIESQSDKIVEMLLAKYSA